MSGLSTRGSISLGCALVDKPLIQYGVEEAVYRPAAASPWAAPWWQGGNGYPDPRPGIRLCELWEPLLLQFAFFGVGIATGKRIGKRKDRRRTSDQGITSGAGHGC